MNSDIEQKIIGIDDFFQKIKLSLVFKEAASVVRMGDGEKLILKNLPLPRGTHEKLGLSGISHEEAVHRIRNAASECTWFAPSISGLTNDNFNLYDEFPARDWYVDNFFVNKWTDEQKRSLFEIAGHVLFIHNNPHTADSMQIRVQANLGVKVDYIPLSSWTQTEDVIKKACSNKAQLVLFSAGPAGKYIGPRIAQQGNKVAIDLGNAADLWTFSNLPADRDAANKFYSNWIKK